MMVFYHRFGARDYEIGLPAFPQEEWLRIKRGAVRLLRGRGAQESADLLENNPFEMVNATNGFGDEFTMLHFRAHLSEYLDLSERHQQAGHINPALGVANALRENGFPVRIVAVDLLEEDAIRAVASPSLPTSSAVVERALDDAQHLISARGSASAVDRVHTALHGYLRDIAVAAGMHASGSEGESIQRLLSWLVSNHPHLRESNSEEIRRIVRSFGGTIESLAHFRNNSSLAHPNADILGEPEAMLAINAARTILHYIAQRLS